MIVPSIDLMDGGAVQLRRGSELEIDAGDPRPLAERFGLCGEIAVIDLDAALGRGDNGSLIRALLEIAPCRVGGGIRSAEAALDWLDAGAERVILGTAATPEVLAELPAERVIAALDARHGDVVVEGWTRPTGRGVAERMRELEGLAGGFLVTFVEVEGTLEGLPLDRVPELIEAAGAARVTFAGGIRSAAELRELDRLGADAQVGMAIYRGDLELADALAAPLRSDRPDGLWPTLVEDTSGRVLGLAFSDAESLRAAVRERRGIYRSRSRGLWRKGETSGATQELVRVALDCDRDALLFTVRQAGSGFCHTGNRSCFETGPQLRPFRLADLEARVRARLEEAPAGSLTARLRAEPDLLAAKLVEEAGELAAAGSAGEAVAELADVLYFGFVRLVESGGTLEAVERELGRRARAVRRRTPREPGPVGGAGPVAVGGADPGAAAGPDPGAGSEAGAAAARQPGATAAPRRTDGEEILPALELAEAVHRVRQAAVDAEAERVAREIFDDVERRGEPALREHAERLGDLEPGAPLVVERAALAAASQEIDVEAREVLGRAADRIERFARAQREAASGLDVEVSAGRAGHRLAPVESAGCYAPGGIYPLPSSMLMTAIPARVAGVTEVWSASPRPGPVMRAAAARAGADGLLAVGGAQAIAALACGVGGPPPCDVVVGPGNRYVTAAKRLAYGRVGIDMLAGPSELLVIAGPDADPVRVAADLLAQAEHDERAVPLLCALDAATIDEVRCELERQLTDLPARDLAVAALRRGGAIVATDAEAAARASEALRPEHLHLQGREAEALLPRLRRYGTVFVGGDTPEAAGDYGAGPNHTLPTGGTAGFASGLSVFSFLRRPTWLELDRSHPEYAALLRDTARLARLEGLEAHARSAELRLAEAPPSGRPS